MAVGYNPRMITNGLVAYWDAGNTQRSARGFKNLLNLSSWTLGTDSASGNGGTTFNRNGTVAENQRILDTGPFGVSTVVWDTPSNDADSNDDGGWNTGNISIDSSKMYRFSVWMRRKIIGNGPYYLGTMGFNAAGANEGVLNRTNAAINTNLYFSAGGWPTGNVPANSWMLVVGHVWPAGSGAGADHSDSGLWNTSGVKFSNYTSSGDAIWQATNTITWHRSYLYYSTDTTTNQQWYQPRIDLVDGSQPSIADLISGVGSKWYDLVGSNHGNITNSAALYNSSGIMTFDGVDDYVDLSSLGNIGTVIAWVKPTAVSGDYVIFGPNSNGQDNWLGINGGKIYCLFTESSDVNNTALVGNTTLSTNTWYQIACTISTNTFKVYLNGLEDGTSTVAFTIGSWSGTSAIGRRGGLSQRYFPGNIGNISIYNRVLNAEEMKQNFNALRGRFGI